MAIMRKPVVALIFFLVVVALLAWIVVSIPASPQQGSAVAPTATQQPLPLTDAVKAQLAASKGFQVLISYTSHGFEPAMTTIKKGDTVRFTNNSSGDLWVASTGTSGKVYPGTGKECGESAFDSCRIIVRGEFWEFTFAKAGTWSYQNNQHSLSTGVVKVQ